MGLEGHIDIALHWDGKRIGRVEVRSRRPQVATRLLVGQTAAQAVQRVPLVFSVCARAQEAAARAATAAALGSSVPREPLRVLAESVHESFWRILCDWPELLGEARDTAALAALRRAVLPLVKGETSDPREGAAACAALLTETILGVPPATWVAAVEAGGAAAWWARGRSVAARLLAGLPDSFADDPAASPSVCRPLPLLSAEDYGQALGGGLAADPDFALRPTWEGAAAETGAMARGLPLLAPVAEAPVGSVRLRLLARLLDGVRRVEQLAAAGAEGALGGIDAARAADGSGWGVVDTARGTLIHVVRFAGERIADYRIIAPTEWNFHPQGPLPGLLAGAVAETAAAAERLAALAVQALDPCVAHRVEVVNA